MTRKLAAGHEFAGEVEPTSEQPPGATERAEHMSIAHSGAERQDPPEPPVDEAELLETSGRDAGCRSVSGTHRVCSGSRQASKACDATPASVSGGGQTRDMTQLLEGLHLPHLVQTLLHPASILSTRQREEEQARPRRP